MDTSHQLQEVVISPPKKYLGMFYIMDWVAAHYISEKGSKQMNLPISKLCAFTNSVTISQFNKNHFTDSGTISRNASPYIGKYYISQLQRTEQSKSHNFVF